MPSRKQVDLVMDDEVSGTASSLLQQIRNMWEFANLCQWIYIFGKAAKIDEALEIEVRSLYIRCTISYSLLT